MFYASAFHVDSTLADGTYELVPAFEEDPPEGEVNALVADQASPDPETNCEPVGKPRSIT